MDDPNTTLLGVAPSLDPNRTVMGGPTGFERTITIKPVQCPVCKSMNPPGLWYCNECGLIFEMALDGDAFGAPSIQLPVLVETGGREHILRPGVQVIGRAGDIAIDDTRVSRRHASVTLDGHAVRIEDLGSTNGTKVDGVAIAQGSAAELAAGTIVSLGGLELTLAMPGEANRTVQALSGRTTALAAPPTTSDVRAWVVFDDREVPLGIGSHTFGRRDGNDIVISDPYVSGSHGTLNITEDGAFLTDTGSTNGTVVNEAKIAAQLSTMIGPNDVVKLGSVEFCIRFRS